MDYDLIEYDEDYQSENIQSSESSPQTSTNKYKTPTSTQKFCIDSVIINEDSLESNDSNQNIINDDETDVIDGDSTPGTSIDEHTSYSASTSQIPSNVVNRQVCTKFKNQRRISRKHSKLKGFQNTQSDNAEFSKPRYPLRSRTRLDQVKSRIYESVVGKKSLSTLPNEIYYRIFQYLPIQDLCRIQRVNKRFRESVDCHLVMVKRINFSCGLPFAFLPECLNDGVLKRILSKTPEVTHILGFYPKKVEDVPGFNNNLTYNGIMMAFKTCTKLRSVEIMDLELMNRIVIHLNRVKFHGMFRNRPHSWQEEYINPNIENRSSTSSTTSQTVSMSSYDSLLHFSLNSPFTTPNKSQHPLQGGKLAALRILMNLANMKPMNNLFSNFATYNWLSYVEKQTYTPIGSGLQMSPPINQSPMVSYPTPVPSIYEKINIPNTIANLTKLDLVSVCIPHLPRLENIKYLHLKWVRFSSPDPFQNFQSPKIQSFVMNNCIGPVRNIRYVRLYSALARATQLNRLELISMRTVEGLFENLFHELDFDHRCFKNLQRLVLSSNRAFSELDIASLMIYCSTTLNHLALSSTHSTNTLMLCLANSNVVMEKLESVILGYQDPCQSMLSSQEIRNTFSMDSPDHTNPICKVTDRGLAALMKVAPNLVSLHLRHAVYTEDPSMWIPNKWSYPIGNERNNNSNTTFILKSLTLEHCTSIKSDKISFILNHPASCFPNLEMLILRNMFERLPPLNMPIKQRHLNVSVYSQYTNGTPSYSNSNGAREHRNIDYFKTDDLLFRPDLFLGLDNIRYLPLLVSPQSNSSSGNNNSEGSTNTPLPSSNFYMPPMRFGQNPGLYIPMELGMHEFAQPNTTNTSAYSSLNMFGISKTGLSQHASFGVMPGRITPLIYSSNAARSLNLIPNSALYATFNNLNQYHRLELMGLADLVKDVTYSKRTEILNQITNNLTSTSRTRRSFNLHMNHNQVDIDKMIIYVDNNNKRKYSHTAMATSSPNQGILIHKSKPVIDKNESSPTPAKRRKISDCKRDSIPSKSRSSKDAQLSSQSNSLFPPEFSSTSTQTCVCGHLDWINSSWQRDILKEAAENNTKQDMCYYCRTDCIHICPHKPSGGSMQTKTTNPMENSEQSDTPKNKKKFKSRKSGSKKTGLISVTDYWCKLCSFTHDIDNQISTISKSQPEPSIVHSPREWCAQDVSVDTTSLLLTVKPQLYRLELKQNNNSHLTTLHLEKVGLTHIVLTSCHRLKSITLENCPELQSIVINNGGSTAPPSDSIPSLRRIRIMRCPKFAIYNLLYYVTRFYPQHDDNLYITYRPFGEYNPLVEKALWLNSDCHHVMVSHGYRQDSSERDLEELCSSFDQLFREMLSFSESLIRREILSVSDFTQINNFSNGSFLRSQHGTDWDLLADIPWVNEVCCSMLPSDLGRSQHADQLYELLSEVQSSPVRNFKLRRRGIHYHVQLRDVNIKSKHSGCSPSPNPESLLEQVLRPGTTSTLNLPYPYTDDYILSTDPIRDLNANFCEPALPYNYVNEDHSATFEFDKLYTRTRDRVSVLPAYLRELIEPSMNDGSEECYFQEDVDEKFPFPNNSPRDRILLSQSISSHLFDNNTSNSSTTANTSFLVPNSNKALNQSSQKPYFNQINVPSSLPNCKACKRKQSASPIPGPSSSTTNAAIRNSPTNNHTSQPSTSTTTQNASTQSQPSTSNQRPICDYGPSFPF